MVYKKWNQDNAMGCTVVNRDNYYWWIDVEVNGAKKRSPFKYNGKQVNEKIFELYKFYYDKNKI